MSLALCSSNYSIGILNSMDDRVLSIQNNVIDGLSGDVSVVLFQSLNLRHTSYRLSFFTSMSISFLPLRMAGKLRWSHNSFVIDQILFFSIRKCQFKSIYEFRKSTVRSNETVEYLMNRDVSIRYHLMRKMETAGFLTTKFFFSKLISSFVVKKLANRKRILRWATSLGRKCKGPYNPFWFLIFLKSYHLLIEKITDLKIFRFCQN